MPPTTFEVAVPGATLVGERHEIGDWYGEGIDHDSLSAPLVLLHAGVADRRSWHRVVPTFSTTRPVVAYDRRGYGDSTWVEQPHDEVADLLAVMDAHGTAKATLVGNSKGGLIALEAALAHPERVAGLLLIAPALSGAPQPTDVPEHVEAMDEAAEAAQRRGNFTEANRLEANLWLDGPDATSPRVDAGARSLFLEMNGRALAAEPTGEALAHPPVWSRLAELSLPILVVVGDLDLPHMLDWAQHVARQAPNAECTIIRGVAHLPQLEAHQRFLGAVTPFLAATA